MSLPYSLYNCGFACHAKISFYFPSQHCQHTYTHVNPPSRTAKNPIHTHPFLTPLLTNGPPPPLFVQRKYIQPSSSWTISACRLSVWLPLTLLPMFHNTQTHRAQSKWPAWHYHMTPHNHKTVKAGCCLCKLLHILAARTHVQMCLKHICSEWGIVAKAHDCYNYANTQK